MAKSAETEDSVGEPTIRLQRFLAACGLGSRRNCEELVKSGRITVDGEVTDALGAKVNPSVQRIAFDGETLRMERKKYYVLNKPTGYLCTNNDPAGRRRVIDLFPSKGPRLFTVGRLDENSEGLLLVTNDGDFAQKLAHPRYRIYRTYRVQVAGNPSREALEQLKKGLHFREGKFRIHDVRWLKKQGKSTFLELVLGEGQNREIRRLLARIGHKVLTLQRIAFGPIRLGRLPVGEHRELSREDIASLFEMLERNVSGAAGRPQPAAGRKSRATRERSADKPAKNPAGSRTAAARPPAKKPAKKKPRSGAERDSRRR